MKKKQTTKPHLNKWVYILFFAVTMLCSLFVVKKFDNDLWYLLSEGRYIVQNGIYKIDPLSMHEGLKIVVQNWLSASILWLVFDSFGEIGILTIVLLCNFFIVFIAYKISMLLSDDNPLLSLIMAFAMDIILISNYLVTRPQIMSFIILLCVIYILELYIKTDKGKYLIWLPILSLIEINLHASLWWMIFLFTLPYIIDSFKCKLLKTQGYRKKPLFIAVIIALLVGFINPYGYKMITFIFTSFTDKYMHIYITELLPFSINNTLGKQMFGVTLLTTLCAVFFREGNVRVRYICLYCGTLLLGLISVKGFSNYILVSIIPFAYFFKDMFPKSIYEDLKPVEPILKIVYMILSLLVIGLCLALYITAPKRLELKHDASKAFDAIETKFDKETTKVYVSFNDGGYVEYRGYKPYIDPRAEVYLKINNKKADIFKENYELAHGMLNTKEFLEKYKFDLLLVSNSDYLYDKLEDIDNYFIIFESSETSYRVYARDSLFTPEEKENIVKQYKDAVKRAKADAEIKKD